MKIKSEIIVISLLVIFYAILEVNMFDSETVFMLLSPNEGISLISSIHFTLFAILRLAIYLCLPVYLILRTALILTTKDRISTPNEKMSED